MYLISAYLATFYNWWRVRVQKHPFLWQIGIAVSQFLLFSILASLFQDETGPIGVLLFLAIMAFLVPGFFAAGTVRKEQLEKKEGDQSRLREIWRLLDQDRKK